MLLAVQSPASAQALPDDSSSPGSTDTITVRGRRSFDDRFSSTASTITVGRQDIEAMGANTIGGIMRQLPGMQVTTTANGGLEIRMRGMGPENTRILIDGAPVSASRRDTQLPLDELPADLIERVEVVRSPTAQFEGAAGGTINIVLRPARAKRETYVWLVDQHVWGRNALLAFISQTGPLGSTRAAPTGNDEPAWTYFISLTGGPRNLGSDTVRESQVRAATPLASSALSLTDSFRLRNQSWTLTPRISGRLSATDQLTIRSIISTLDQQGRVQAGGAGEVGGAATMIASQTSWSFDRSFYQLAADWTHRFKDAKMDSSLSLEQASNVYRTGRDSSTVQNAATSTQSSAFANDQSERTVLATSKLSVATGASIWTLGAEFDLRRNEASATTTSAGVPSTIDLNASIRRNGLWAQHEMPIDSLKSTLTAGLRAQGYAISGATVGATLDYHQWFWQPSLNARTRIAEDTQLRWNLARVTRTPRIWELLERVVPNLSSNGPNNPDFIGNANLKPEATVSADVGIDQRFANNGQAGVNLFARSQTDVIARRLFNQNGQWLEQPTNVGDAIVWGLETDLRRDLRWAGLGPEWTLSANATLLQSRMRSGEAIGNRIPGQARYLANLTIAKPLRVSGGWYGGGTLALVGSSDLNAPSGTGVTVTGQQRPHAQLDLYIGSVDTRWGFWRLNVYNLTDFRKDVSRTIVDGKGIVYADHTVQRLTPRVFLTVGTRF